MIRMPQSFLTIFSLVVALTSDPLTSKVSQFIFVDKWVKFSEQLTKYCVQKLTDGQMHTFTHTCTDRV